MFDSNKIEFPPPHSLASEATCLPFEVQIALHRANCPSDALPPSIKTESLTHKVNIISQRPSILESFS